MNDKKTEIKQDAHQYASVDTNNTHPDQLNGVALGKRSIIFSIVLLSLAMIILGGLLVINIVTTLTSSSMGIVEDILFFALYIFMPIGVTLAILALVFQVKSQKQMKKIGELTPCQKKVQKTSWILIGVWAIPIVLACVIPLLFAMFALIVGLHD